MMYTDDDDHVHLHQDLQAATVNPDPSLKEFEGATLRYASLKLRWYTYKNLYYKIFHLHSNPTSQMVLFLVSLILCLIGVGVELTQTKQDVVLRKCLIVLLVEWVAVAFTCGTGFTCHYHSWKYKKAQHYILKCMDWFMLFFF